MSAAAPNSANIPPGYEASRRRFRELAQQAGAELASFAHRAESDTGFILSTDTALLGSREARTVIVIASGTHGVEGYAGALCQFRFLEAWRSRPPTVGVAWLLVHAVNPWGYLHDSRVTAEGVDLNRNFLDFPLSATGPSDYSRHHAMLVGDMQPGPRGWLNELRLLSWGLTRARRRALQQAVTGGQHDRPDGLFHCGTAPTECRVVWERIVATYMIGYARAVLLDLHTGLGRRGSGELISDLAPAHPDFLRQSSWFGGELRSMVQGGSVSATLSGTLSSAFAASVPGEAHAVGLEFGTCPALVVLRALRLEQWCRNLGEAATDAQREQARAAMKRAFAPADPAWAAQVLARFDEVIDRLGSALSPALAQD